MGKTTWTAGEVALVESLWMHGASATEIAERIGTTRSAVLGKINRLGLLKTRDPEVAKENIRLAAMARWAHG